MKLIASLEVNDNSTLVAHKNIAIRVARLSIVDNFDNFVNSVNSVKK